jgi:hypothetical protein
MFNEQHVICDAMSLQGGLTWQVPDCCQALLCHSLTHALVAMHSLHNALQWLHTCLYQAPNKGAKHGSVRMAVQPHNEWTCQVFLTCH